MPNKAQVETTFVDMATALTQFAEPENLLSLLREGSLVAYGRCGWSGLGPNDHLGRSEEIPASVWADYRFVPGPNFLTDDYENFYTTIRLKRTALSDCLAKPDSRSELHSGKGGRPATYNWDKLMPEFLNAAFEDEPTSLDGWVKKSQELGIYGAGSVPDEKTLRDKLRPFFQRIFKA